MTASRRIVFIPLNYYCLISQFQQMPITVNITGFRNSLHVTNHFRHFSFRT